MDAKFAGSLLSARLGAAGAMVLVTLLVGGAAPRVMGQVIRSPGASDSSDQDVVQTSHSWFAALMNADLDLLDRLETDDFLMVQKTATGVAVVDKKGQLESLAKAPSDRPRFERELLNVKVRRYGAVAVLTALARFRGHLNEKPVFSQTVESEVWFFEAGRWRLAHYQTTDAPPAAAR